MLTALTLLVAAAAATPLFAIASDDAAVRTVIEAVPSGASAADAPVVRLNGGETPTQDRQEVLLRSLAAVPGLSVGVPTGGSVGVELAGLGTTFRPFVASGGKQARARLYGQDDLAAQLVPAPGSPAVGSAGAGVWLPQPVAATLGVHPGDQVTVGVVEDARTTSVRTRLAGIYQVAPGSRRPADPRGTQNWAQRNGLLPTDSEFISSPAYLVVADVRTAQRLADAVGDHLFWTVEAHLDPAVPTLAEAQRTSSGVVDLQRDLLNPTGFDLPSGPLRPVVVSGLPQIIGDAESMTGETLARTRTLSWAGVGIAMVAVLAVAVLTVARRRREITHATSSGFHPLTLGGQAALEVLAVAVLATALGTTVAVAVVGRWGPQTGRPTTDLGPALGTGAVAAAAGVLMIALVTATAAARVAHRSAAGTRNLPVRRLPWEVALAVAAATAAWGLLSRPGGSSTPGTLDLLVPALVVAAVGAVGGRLLLDLLARAGTRAARSRRDHGPLRAPALWLAARRVAVPGPERILVVAVLATGLGMLLYAVSATTAVRLTTTDRVAVLSGATATAELPGSWVLDPSAPQVPEPIDPDHPPATPPPKTPPATDPVVPPGDAVLWRRNAVVPSQAGQVQLLIVDPTAFAAAASWGAGPELAHARSLLPSLASAGHEAASQVRAGQDAVPVPALLVGGPHSFGIAATATSPGLSTGQVAAVDGGMWTLAVHITATVEVFPGFTGPYAMLVMPSDAFFAHLGDVDPRYRPKLGEAPRDTEFVASLWSAHGVAGLQTTLAAKGADAPVTTTEAQVSAEPAFIAAGRSLGYLLALGLGVAALAVITLGLYADRAATRSRPADVMLARVGVGRRGTQRARLLELALLVGTAVVAAVVGVMLTTRLGPLGMDPGATSAPAFHLSLSAGGLLVVVLAAVLALGVATAVAAARTTRRTEGTVLRDGG